MTVGADWPYYGGDTRTTHCSPLSQITRGVIVTGAQVKDGQSKDARSGVILGYDAITGDLARACDLAAPEQNRDGPTEGETYTRGTPNMWSAGVAEEELG
ncbi:hypothetical protein [Sulfitobacter sp. THAF37]|uniref:hypothetical protein n=1 Tax=Sulfitobacter sp. THAF37 TaxID=2587855 RepID=UPI0020C758AA|nr:hypothetical protein [Sulfitobacter sp. THAF37]